MATTMSRRQLVGGLAAAGVGVGLSLNIANANASYDEYQQGVVGAESGTDLSDARYDVDLLVVGSGCAGVSAAVEGADQGLTVLMCEASPFFGGTTTATEGMLGLNTKYLDKLGISTDLKEAAADEYACSNYLANRYIINDFINKADDNFVWMEEYCGVQFEQEVTCNTLNPYQHFYVGKGAGMIGTMVELAEQKGVNCLLENCVKRAVLEEGKVVGAIVEDESGEYPVKCKAMVLATGGFAQNPELISQKLAWLNTDRCINTSLGRVQGDGYYISVAAGGDTHGMCTCGWYDPALKSFYFGSELSVAACNTPYLWVNERAERWINEDMTLRFSEVCYALFSQRRALAILSQSAVDRMIEEGCPVGWAGYILNGTKLTDLQNQLNDAMDTEPEGFFWGNNVAELADSMGVDPDALQATIDRYATMVEKGVDEDFGKDPTYLWEAPVDGERLYGFELCANLLNVSGGIVIDPTGAVVTVDGAPIPGLYAAGADASGLLGFIYPNKYASTKQGFCLYSGRLCAQSAAKYVAGA